MLTCTIEDYNWNKGVLNYHIESDTGSVDIFKHTIFMFYSKAEAIKVLKENIREDFSGLIGCYGGIKFKVECINKTNANKNVKTYDLQPINGEKSFYGKAKIHQFANGDEVLQSYDTMIVCRKKSGELVRLWDGWSYTTGRHIKAFCGLNKAGFDKLPFEN